MPYLLCWAACGIMSPRRELENVAFPSWHFARSNEEIGYGDDTCKKGKSGYRYERPLLSYFHSPELDPESSVAPKYLCCVAKIVSLVADSEFEPSQRISLRLVGFTVDFDRQVRIASQNDGGTYDSSGNLNITFDHVWESGGYCRRTWTLMPVYISGHPMPGTAQEKRLCFGLVLERTANGDFVRKGAFNIYGDSTVCAMGVLLEALSKTRPEFVMIA